MPENGFGIDEQEYNQILKDEGYFKGVVISEIRANKKETEGIKKELKNQREKDDCIIKKLNGLPCTENKWKMRGLLLLIIIIFVLLGIMKVPLTIPGL